MAELDGSNQIVSRFVYASKPHVPDYMIRDGEVYRIISDHVGSVRLVLSAATGVVAQRIDYDPFGQVTVNTNPGFQPFGFGGGIYDELTGLTRLGLRDYDARAGRWTSKDPIGFLGGSTNLYAFAGNSPVTHSDPWGRQSGGIFWDWVIEFLNRPVLIEVQNNATWDNVSPNVRFGIEMAARCAQVAELVVSSTTGGEHTEKSRHYANALNDCIGKAADISSLNGQDVATADSDLVERFQNCLNLLPFTRENFGPAFLTKNLGSGAGPNPWCTSGTQACLNLISLHDNHVHFSVNR